MLIVLMVVYYEIIMKKIRFSPGNLFLLALVVAAILFIFDVHVNNDVLTDNIKRIYSALAFSAAELVLFILGLKQSLKAKSRSWLNLNILAIFIIVGWAFLSCAGLYAFNNVQLVLPP
jgi:hypothetical protein